MYFEAANKLILVVDDTPTNIAVISGVLKEDGYRLKVATNGEKALELAAADQAPDLILLDIMMPGLDGYEVCRRLKADPATREIPVIFLTALTESQDEETGFQVGAVDYIHKPFSPPIVRARVKTHLMLREALNQALDALRRVDQALAREKQYLQQVEQARRQQELLSQISDALSTSLDYGATLEGVCRLAVPVLADWCTVDTLAADGSSEYVAAAHADPAMEPLVLELHERYTPALDDLVPASQVLRSDQPVLLPRLDETIYSAAAPETEVGRLIHELGPVSVIAVPLEARERTIGVLTLVSARADLRYDLADLPLLQEIAHRCAMAVDNARLYRQAREEAVERSA